jgi:NAD(P)-dependent dehydrogenase (short-subunit alcohol dehydrogenase family)
VTRQSRSQSIAARTQCRQAGSRRRDAHTEIETDLADLSDLDTVKTLAEKVTTKHDHLDVLINNAGIFKTHNTVTKDGFDVRFVVNTIAPYLLTKELLP